jgi:hypothetical protein
MQKLALNNAHSELYLFSDSELFIITLEVCHPN